MRWMESKNSGAASHPQSTTSAGSDAAPYTAEEKQWLKDNYDGEFRFLKSHELSIYKEEDREEGRRIVRSFMEESDNAHDDVSITDMSDESNDFLADLEADPTSHLADRFFSEAELDWIQKHYRHSGNFLLTHGLKPFDDEDCEEGVAIARAFMSGDE